MKVEFELDAKGVNVDKAKIRIIGTLPKYRPYVSVFMTSRNGVELTACVPDKELERLAVNILKALKPKKLKA